MYALLGDYIKLIKSLLLKNLQYFYHSGQGVDTLPKSIQITALTADQLAQLLAQTARRAVSSEQVLEIAETAGIVSEEGTINLIDYTAFLVTEVSNGSH